jgi:hypothetical protein
VADTEERTPSELLCDLLVYAPLGFAFEAPRLVPELAAKGRNQVAAARSVGRFVVQQANDRLGPLVGSMVGNVLSTLGLVEAEQDEAKMAREPAPSRTTASGESGVVEVDVVNIDPVDIDAGHVDKGEASRAAEARDGAGEPRVRVGGGTGGAAFDPGLGGTGDPISVPAAMPGAAMPDELAAAEHGAVDLDRPGVEAAADLVSGTVEPVQRGRSTATRPRGAGGPSSGSSDGRRRGREPADQPGGVPDAASLAIPDYDSLAASQVVPRLAALSTDELDAVRSYESAHRGRRTILGRVDQLLARSSKRTGGA